MKYILNKSPQCVFSGDAFFKVENYFEVDFGYLYFAFQVKVRFNKLQQEIFNELHLVDTYSHGMKFIYYMSCGEIYYNYLPE